MRARDHHEPRRLPGVATRYPSTGTRDVVARAPGGLVGRDGQGRTGCRRRARVQHGTLRRGRGRTRAIRPRCRTCSATGHPRAGRLGACLLAPGQDGYRHRRAGRRHPLDLSAGTDRRVEGVPGAGLHSSRAPNAIRRKGQGTLFGGACRERPRSQSCSRSGPTCGPEQATELPTRTAHDVNGATGCPGCATQRDA